MKQPPKDAEGFARWLVAHGACWPAREWAAGKSRPEIWASCQNGEWMEWLLDECGYTWTPETRAEYLRVKNTVWGEYLCVKAKTLSEFLRIKDVEWHKYRLVNAEAIATEYHRVTDEAPDKHQRALAEGMDEYLRVMAKASDERKRIMFSATTEYDRVMADAIRSIIGYPFRDNGKEV